MRYSAALFGSVSFCVIDSAISSAFFAGSGDVTPAGASYRDFVQPFVSECQTVVNKAFELSDSRCEVVGKTVTLETGATIKLRSEDVVIAKTKRDASSFCNKKAKFSYLAGVDRMVTAELAVASGIPIECRDRVVVYERLGKTLDSMALDDTLAYTLSAEMLELVRTIHETGFVHGRLFQSAFGFGQDGELVLGALDSVNALYETTGHIDQRNIGGIKMDLQQFHETIMLLIGRNEVYEAIVHDVDRSSIKLERIFDYGKWINILRALGNGEDPEFERAPKGHPAIEDATSVARFVGINGDCLTHIPEDLPACRRVEGCVCPPVEEFEAEGLDYARVMRPDSRNGDYSGDYGVVYELDSEPRALMKVYSEDRIEDPQVLCSEKSMLTVLDGFYGLAPRIFEITGGVHEACKIKSFVMEYVGDENISIEDDLWRRGEPVFYSLVARMIEILRDLHEMGFIHADAHVGNWKLESLDDIEHGLKLIDFGLSRPYVDPLGRHLVDEEHPSMLDRETSRREDMKKLASEIKSAPGPMNVPVLIEFAEEMESLGREERPNYEKWIPLFRSLATA